MNPSPELSESIAMIVGAGRAPAQPLALALAQHGVSVAVNDLSPTLLDPLVDAAAGLPGRMRAYPADATRGMPLRAMIDEILDDWGAIDVLINNPRIQPAVPLIDMDEWDWQRTVEMNLSGPFMTMQLVARLMREQGNGVIINIIDANRERLDAPGASAYAATQSGLHQLSRRAAEEFLAYNIRVYTLCLEGAAMFDRQGSAQADGAVRTGGLLAQLAVFLSSPAAASLPGREFLVRDGRVDPAPFENWQSSVDLYSGSKE